MNCKFNSRLCKDYVVYEYPSIRIIKSDGNMIPYMDKLNATTIISFIYGMTGFFHLFFSVSGIPAPVAPPVDLLEYLPPSSISETIKDSSHITLLFVWRSTDNNTQGVEVMRHLAWIFLVHPSVRFYQTPLSADLPSPITKVLTMAYPQYLVSTSVPFYVGDFPWESATIRGGSECEPGRARRKASGCAE